MSSHHIIRDKQEPGLIIWDLSQIDREYFGQLLEWSPTIVGFENSIDSILSLGIKLDILIIYKNQVEEWVQKLEEQFPLEVIPFSEPSDLLQIAVEVLVNKDYKAANLIGNEVTLTQFRKLLLKFHKQIDLTLITSANRYLHAKNGDFEKWYPSNCQIGILPFGEEVMVTTKGFLDDHTNKSVRGNFLATTQYDGIVKVESKGHSFIIEEFI